MSQLEWGEIAARFAAARNWWIATAGTGGPHAVPVWGVAHEDVLVFWGSPTAVRSRNLREDPRLVIHLEDGEDPLILHGRADPHGLVNDDAALVRLFREKYRGEHDGDYLPGTGYTADAIAYRVVPTKALAWRVVALDAWTVRRWANGDSVLSASAEPQG